MTTKVVRRLLLAVPLTLVVSFLTFLLSHVAGGSYFDQFKTDRRFDPAQIRALERQAHLDEPLLLQYLYWLRGACFDFRIGRPRRVLVDFEQPLIEGRDYVPSPGLTVQRVGGDVHDGIRALRVTVPAGGGSLRLALAGRPENRSDERADRGTLQIWRKSSGASQEWTAVAVARSDGTADVHFEQAGVVDVDQLEEVEPKLDWSCGRPDFGRSFKYDAPVFDLLLPAFKNSGVLALATLAATWALAIPFGVWCATHRRGLVDRVVAVVTFAGVSAPGFFVALIALVAAVEWAHASFASGLLLPVAVLTIGSLASVQRTLRTNLIESMHAPFVVAARARGLPERRVVLLHALRTAMNPLVTLFGIRLAELLSGAALVEIVFQYPGIGRLVLEATIARDLYVVMGAVLLGALILVAANLLADLLLQWLDPRIGHSRNAA